MLTLYKPNFVYQTYLAFADFGKTISPLAMVSTEQKALKNYRWALPKGVGILREVEKKSAPKDKIIIFLVDDDKPYLRALKHSIEVIKDDRIETHTFSTGEECIQNVKVKPSIIVLDYYLNHHYYDAMNGLNVLRKIKQTSPETKIIMLSSQRSMDVAIDMLKYNAYDYVTKNDGGFTKVNLTIQEIINDIDSAKTINKENKKHRVINISIIALLILLFLFLKMG
jgi:ActR/RegA family two-component response regulator